MSRSSIIAVAPAVLCVPLKTPRRVSGFTLVELLVLAFVLGIFALTVRPNLRPANEYTLDRSAHEVAEAIRFARSEAIRTGDVYGVQIDDASGRIRPFRGDVLTSPMTAIFDVRHPLSKQTYEIDLQDRAGSIPVEVVSTHTHAAACAVPNEIVFHGRLPPRCSDPLSSLLSSASIALSVDGIERVVTVDGETGRTTVQ